MACVYPDARTPVELWENVLAQRRAFRRMPAERLRAEDYWSADRSAADSTYAIQAAVIEGYEFDRLAFRVAGSTYRSADLAHWLALDVAAKALTDAGFPEGRGLPRESTGVLLGNTLTGEFSRAGLLRLRWPYVRRVLGAALEKEGWSSEQRGAFLERVETDYKSPFPVVGEESLAGGLSNTIAGRICNQFDLKGGGFTVDGACASSLLAVANACSALTAGDLDVALAGGVDLSLDPFELVGFAKTGALAADEMRVFDKRSAGFWPGEGSGFVVLMRCQDALAQGCRVYAVIRGWGISSDGNGGITRPEANGQLEALRRAYRRAGFGIETVAYCEGHGTGTAVGDATELEVLSRARREATPDVPIAAVGSIKANIGHTKAAAGIAGFIKATMAVHTQVLPPTSGCEEPHPQLAGSAAVLRVLREAELWPADQPLRASVSAMGFGGINAHVVVESVTAERRNALGLRERLLSHSCQDAELFLLAGPTVLALREQVAKLVPLAARISRAEMSDLAAELQKNLRPGRFRAALVAVKPAELAEKLQTLTSWLEEETVPRFRLEDGACLGGAETPPRIAFLFPGQGSPSSLDGGAWRRRFDRVREWYAQADLPLEGDAVSTRIMQPAVVAASVAGLKVLEACGIRAEAAIGHSLGEITAMHWAGVLSEDALMRVARVRGAAMATLGSATGAMLAISAPWTEVKRLLGTGDLSIVGYNSPRQTVVAGEAAAIASLAERALAAGHQATRLQVSHAFHTPLVAAAVPVLVDQLACENFARLERKVVSTVTGAPLDELDDLPALLARQVTTPVRFQEALALLLGLNPAAGSTLPPGRGNNLGQHRQRAAAATKDDGGVDLLIEVGPGQVLSGLVRDTTEAPVVALDAGGPSLKSLLRAVGAAFVLGAAPRTEALFEDRFTRPFALDWKPKFLSSPCELAPLDTGGGARGGSPEAWARNMKEVQPAPDDAQTEPEPEDQKAGTSLDLVKRLVAERAELPLSAVQDDHRMLNDLHLNSITVGQLVSEAARRLGVPRVIGLTEFANVSVTEMARALEDLKRTGSRARNEDLRRQPPGVDVWTETFLVELVEAPRPSRPERPPLPSLPAAGTSNRWQVFAPPGHPSAADLGRRLASGGTGGVLVWLPEAPSEEHLSLLLGAARAVAALEGNRRFVLVQHGWGGGGFARTLHLETPGLTTCVVSVPPAGAAAVDWVAEEAAQATGYSEAHFDEAGTRREPRLNLAPALAGGREAYPIDKTDVLLVTGGGKGIAAESALALGRATSASLILMGRSEPAADKELAENLKRFVAAGVRCVYARADVTDARAVRAALAEAERKLGPVTAVLHGAGCNTPQLIAELDEAAMRRTLAPKVQGLRNVLAALKPERLRLLVTFGSIIARAGLRGEADYALANEWQTMLTEEFQSRHPGCRCLALEWSVWSGVGMGERLGRVDSLIQQGIMPIHPDEGVRILLERLRRPQPQVALVVSGRFGDPPTLKLARPDLPLRRFLERQRVYYPGVELVVDAELSLSSDPYLDDHVVQKERLLPAVLGLEAMAQAASALVGSEALPVFEHVELTRPVGAAEKGKTKIRLAALRRGPDLVEVCLRSETTDYHVDHFRSLCRFGLPPANDVRRNARGMTPDKRLPLEPEHDLYGSILFHQGRFRRLMGYRLLRAKECLADIGPDDETSWFGPYLPADLLLGDPGVRDASLHAIQACIPHRRLVPTGIDRLVIHRLERGPRRVRATQRTRDGNQFIYDLEVTDQGGELIETWEGLRLHAVEALPSPACWPWALLGPYLERRLEELVPGSSVTVSVQNRASAERSARSTAPWQEGLAVPNQVFRRADGRPVTDEGIGVSAAHACNLTLAVAGAAGVACDLEVVAERDDRAWLDLLGPERLKLAKRISRERSESLNTSATRLWNVVECLKKGGEAVEAPLLLESTTADGWVLFRAGGLAVATCAVAVGETEAAFGVGVALRRTVEGASPLTFSAALNRG